MEWKWLYGTKYLFCHEYYETGLWDNVKKQSSDVISSSRLQNIMCAPRATSACTACCCCCCCCWPYYNYFCVKLGIVVISLGDTWLNVVIAETGWAGISVLGEIENLGEIESTVCKICFIVVAHSIISAYPISIYTLPVVVTQGKPMRFSCCWQIFFFANIADNALQYLVRDGLDAVGGPANVKVTIRHLVKI